MSDTKRATVAEASPSPDPEQPAVHEETMGIGAPPLPDEPEPVLTAPPLPEEDGPAAKYQALSNQEDDVWDPAAETDLKGRKAVEEKTAVEIKDTGGWQAVWASVANGTFVVIPWR
jgi:hypothetical protein